jgi:hypothetical protein
MARPAGDKRFKNKRAAAAAKVKLTAAQEELARLRAELARPVVELDYAVSGPGGRGVKGCLKRCCAWAVDAAGA